MPRKKLKPKILPSGYLRVNPEDPRFRKKLFDAIVKTAGNAKMALTLLHIRKRDFYLALRSCPEFKIAFEKARDQGLDAAEDELIRRAVDGVDRPEFFKGKIVGYVKEYSDYLMIRFLSAYRERYRLPKGSAIKIPVPDLTACRKSGWRPKVEMNFKEEFPGAADTKPDGVKGDL